MLESAPLDLALHHVGGEHDVGRSTLHPTFSERVVDLCGNLVWMVEFSHLAADLGAHLGEHVEVPITKRVVQKHAVLLRDG